MKEIYRRAGVSANSAQYLREALPLRPPRRIRRGRSRNPHCDRSNSALRACPTRSGDVRVSAPGPRQVPGAGLLHGLSDVRAGRVSAARRRLRHARTHHEALTEEHRHVRISTSCRALGPSRWANEGAIEGGAIAHPEHLRGDPREPYPIADRKRNARRPPSFTDQLPWMEFEREHGTFVLEDGVSRALLYELDPLPSEARPEAYLAERAREIQSALSACPNSMTPLGGAVLLQRRYRTLGAIESIQSYILECNANTPARAQEILGSAYTRSFLEDLAEHVRIAARSEGLFNDDAVSGNRWRAEAARALRDLSPVSARLRFSRDPMDPIEALQQAGDGLMAGCARPGWARGR